MVKLVATSVVRGSQQGESHGGVYLIDFDSQSVRQVVDWNTMDIDWQGRGWDRGLRGIAFDGDTIYIAASDELFAFNQDFEVLNSWRNPFLRHCHEISVFERTLFMTSTGYDSILGFNLDTSAFDWGMHIRSTQFKFRPASFDPQTDEGPLMLNKMHLNNVFCTAGGMYITGLHSGGMLLFNGKDIQMAVTLPEGTHNAQPFRDGVLFNDSGDDVVRYSGRGDGGEDRAMAVPTYDDERLERRASIREGIARQGFARGLCAVNERVVAGGSSPSTISLHDLQDNKTLASVNLSMDVRNAIHGLEVWPY